jgi:hypothetical protein
MYVYLSLILPTTCGILVRMPHPGIDYQELYTMFHLPLTQFDCGDKCAPYNEGRIPFCCDTQHAVPTAYESEWEFLKNHTNLWHLWNSKDQVEQTRLEKQCPADQVLIECQGYQLCQRGFRSITCRAFPFFPYISRERIFLGLSYYWEYEDRCWILSHLEMVTQSYRQAFSQAFTHIFSINPAEFQHFWYHSMIMRRVFGRKGRAIPLLHHNGRNYKITPRSGRLRLVKPGGLPLFEPYRITQFLPFKDEINDSYDSSS